MSDFCLEPWEMGPRCREDRCGPAYILSNGNRYRAVEMRRHRWLVFAQDVHEHRAGNWVVATADGTEPQVWDSNPASSKFRLVGNEPSLFGRLFVWGEDMAFLSASGEGAWLNAYFDAETPFAVEAPRDMIERDSKATFAYLTQCLETDCDFAFAKGWSGLEIEARLSALYGSKKLEELRSLMQSVLTLQAISASEADCAWELSPWMSQECQWYSNGQRWWREPDFIYTWGQLIIAYMTHISSEPMRIHPCIDQFAMTPESTVKVEIKGLPTMHQHLEARLYLREWLQENAPGQMDLLSS